MIEFTFLTVEQCFDPSRKLEILKKRGTIAPITDFSILLGGEVSDYYHYSNSKSLEDRSGHYWISGHYWTSSNDKDKDLNLVPVAYDGNGYYINLDRRYGGARPALPYSSICNISSNGVRGRHGILEVEYGEYPQKIASKILQDELERAYNWNLSSIRKTGKTYATDLRRYNEYNEIFIAQIIEEYLFNDGKKYVRVKANSCYGRGGFTLSNGERYKNGDYVWVEVQPIKYLIDEENDIALAERILFVGVQFNFESNYKDFKATDIKKFMDKYFSKEIIPSSLMIEPIINEEIQEMQCELEKISHIIEDGLKTAKSKEEIKELIYKTKMAIDSIQLPAENEQENSWQKKNTN